MPVTSDHIGVTGNAFKRGIPATTITFTGRSGTARTLDIFTSVSKTPMADVAHTQDNNGQELASQRRNKRTQFRFSAKPHGAAVADAQTIAADLPQVNDPCTIVCANDSEIACDGTTDTCLIDAVDGAYSPENEFVIDLTVTKWFAKVFIALS